MKELEQVLIEQINNLKPNNIIVCDEDKFPVYLDRTEKDYLRWKEMLSEALSTAKTFEIHCWNGEEEWIDRALQYGVLKESDWKYGKIIVGSVTPKFADMLLGMPKPQDEGVLAKMTPFFNIFFDNGFQSSHNGTEIFLG